MRARYVVTAALASVLAGGSGAYAYATRPAGCPELQARYFGVEPHEDEVCSIVAEGASCQLRFAFRAASVPTNRIRYAIELQPRAGRLSVDDIGVVYDVPANIGSETFGLLATLPDGELVRSVFEVKPRT